ncbi:MAG: hypothetical protein ACPLRX_07335 [Candidatus Saccharicenans sp.]
MTFDFSGSKGIRRKKQFGGKNDGVCPGFPCRLPEMYSGGYEVAYEFNEELEEAKDSKDEYRIKRWWTGDLIRSEPVG